MNFNPSTSRSIKVGALATAAITMAVSGCGSDDDTASERPTALVTSVAPSSMPGTTNAPAATAMSPSTTAEPPRAEPPTSTEPPAGTEPAPEVNPDGTVTITHEYGTFDVPLEPTRVLVLENRRDLETAVVLELPIVGVGFYGTDTTNVAAPFVPVDLTGVEIISTSELNLERIAVIAPDLILARDIYLDGGESEQLAQIAPILPIAADGSWRDDLERVAAWLHRSDLLDRALAEYDAAFEAVKARHAEALASTPVAIVEYYPADQTFYAGGLEDFQLQANTLGELGGTLVPFLADRSYFDEPFSIENLNEISDAGAILLVASSQADLEALEAHPLWQTLPAVQAGNVVTTDTRTNQGSVFAATEAVRLIDELYATLD